MGENGRFPWEPNLDALALTVEGVANVEVDELDDPIVRADVGDLVNPLQYPDATYWRFNVAGVHGKRVVVKAERVVAVTSVIQDAGAFVWATRTTPCKPAPALVDEAKGLRKLLRSLALFRPPGWFRRFFLSLIRRSF